MDGKLTVKKDLAAKKEFRDELFEVFKNHGYRVVWQSQTEAWLVELYPKMEVHDELG